MFLFIWPYRFKIFVSQEYSRTWSEGNFGKDVYCINGGLNNVNPGQRSAMLCWKVDQDYFQLSLSLLLFQIQWLSQ
jgi:hypothetical protein